MLIIYNEIKRSKEECFMKSEANVIQLYSRRVYEDIMTFIGKFESKHTQKTMRGVFEISFYGYIMLIKISNI